MNATHTTPAAAAAASRKATRDMLNEVYAALSAATAKLRARFGDSATLVADSAKVTARVRSEWSEYAQLVRKDEQAETAKQGTVDKLKAQPAPKVPTQAIPTTKPVSAPAPQAKPAPAPVVSNDDNSDEALIMRAITKGIHPADKAMFAKHDAKAVSTPAVAAHKPAPKAKAKAKFGQERRDLVAACKDAGITGLNRKSDVLKAELAKVGKPAVAAHKPAAKVSTTVSIDVDAAKAELLRKLSTLSVATLETLVGLAK